MGPSTSNKSKLKQLNSRRLSEKFKTAEWKTTESLNSSAPRNNLPPVNLIRVWSKAMWIYGAAARDNFLREFHLVTACCARLRLFGPCFCLTFDRETMKTARRIARWKEQKSKFKRHPNDTLIDSIIPIFWGWKLAVIKYDADPELRFNEWLFNGFIEEKRFYGNFRLFKRCLF